MHVKYQEASKSNIPTVTAYAVKISPQKTSFNKPVYLLEQLHSTGRSHLEHLTTPPCAVTIRNCAREIIPERSKTRLYLDAERWVMT